MQPIPEDILMQFNAVLKQKAVPSSIQDDYRKWLRYYLDFRVKYPPPDSKSEQVRLFIEKMRSKGKSGKDLYHAAQALSLYFSLQYRKKQAGVYADKVRAELSSELARKPLKSHPPLNLPLEGEDEGGDGSYREKQYDNIFQPPQYVRSSPLLPFMHAR